MIKSATFAALTLLATLTAAQAAMKSAVPDLSSAEAIRQTASLPKPKNPPRNPSSSSKAVGDSKVETLQFACQVDTARNPCRMGGPRKPKWGPSPRRA